jgi:EmrB/QacA subfamily drug resistance transporter
MLAAIRRNIIPLIVATAAFMANLDSTVLSTSLPAVAADLGLNPIHLKLALTSYLLALAVFIPASGWFADKFGAKTVFRAAIVVFALGSIACGFSNSLGELVAARVVQGMGGAMMLPVGRLLVWRSVPRSEIISAAAWLTIPALIGPVMGPLLGGFISTYFDWRWIFWINVPVAVLGLVLATRFIPEVETETPEDFDLRGFVLLGPGLSLFLTGVTLLGLDFVTPELVAGLMASGALLLAGYVRHALGSDAPLIDLRLLQVPTFRAGLLGGFLFRIGIGATPFLLPLLLQVAFGMTPFQSGMLTFATGLGAMFMKTQAATILRRYGYRQVLTVNALIAAAFTVMPALFTAATPGLVMIAIFFVGGFSRSLQFTAINTIAYADIPKERLSRATSFAAVGQELSGAVGVAFAALGLEVMTRMTGGDLSTADHYAPVFVAIALVSASSLLVFARLTREAGSELLVKPDRDGKVVPARAVHNDADGA